MCKHFYRPLSEFEELTMKVLSITPEQIIYLDYLALREFNENKIN